MIQRTTIRLAAAILCALLASGCVTGRRVVPLEVPEGGASSGERGEIFVGAVEDARTFENKPAAPSTPSITGNVDSLTPEQKQIFIARQRNGYGKAMGDVVLPDGQTVPERMRLLIKAGLASNGYKLTDDSAAPNSATARVDQFWGWFTPHFATLSFEANVSATITIKHRGKTYELHPKGFGRNQGQVASNANWQVAYSRAFDDFLKNFDSELAKVGH